jgi:hypothetical protein
MSTIKWRSTQAGAVEVGMVLFTGAYVRVELITKLDAGAIPLLRIECKPLDEATPDQIALEVRANVYVSTFLGVPLSKPKAQVVTDAYAPGQFMSIGCGNCKQSSGADACTADSNGYKLPLSQWRCPRCGHHWAVAVRQSETEPGRKLAFVKPPCLASGCGRAARGAAHPATGRRTARHRPH